MINNALAKNPTFQVYFTFEGWMLSNLTAGMSPVSSMRDAITQIAWSGLFRMVSLFYSNDFWRTIRNYQHEGDNENNGITKNKILEDERANDKAGPKVD
jgi:hypothetical protein